MNKPISLALLSFFTVAVHAQSPATSAGPTAAERADRQFLKTIEQRESPSIIPSLPPGAGAPPPATAEPADTPQPKPIARVTPAKAKPKATASSSRSRSAAESAAQRSRQNGNGPVYRGVLVLEPPAVLSRLERKLRPVTRRLEAGPLRFIRITTRMNGREGDD